MKTLISLLATLAFSTLPLAAESLVIVGAGQSGTWDTQFSFANPTSAPLTAQLYFSSGIPTPCISPCPVAFVTVPPMGTNDLWISDWISGGNGSLHTIYVTPANGAPLPTMRARVVNRNAMPDEAVELSVLRLETVLAMNANVLVFPSATRSTAVHSNLDIGSFLADGELAVTIKVEAFDHDGTLLGSGTFSNCVTGCTNIFLVDVLHQVGVDTLDNGQIRVTKVSGDGVLWGELAVLDTVGHVQISLGRNP